MPPSPPPYPLSRSHLSTTRLIAQHTLWQHDLRFLLHPTITTSLFPAPSPLNPPTSSPASLFRIADLATGTALWSLSLLHQYPNLHITASDISLTQTPPREWLPPGLDIQEWDIYAPVPEAWVGKFDVVHIRLALLVIQDNDTSTVLKNAWTMLKPGGWMQWDELDPEGAYMVVAEGAGVEEEEVQRFKGMQEMSDFKGLKWVRGLEGEFEGVGFRDVGREVFEGERSMVGFFQSLQFLVMEEEGGGRGMEGVRGDVQWGLEVGKKGVARVVPKIVVWGRKPLGEGDRGKDVG